MVPLGLRIACRRASWPTSRSPWLVNATTEGVVRWPSALGITVGCPASVAAITELVVPRSMPTAVAILASSQAGGRSSAADLDVPRLSRLGLGHRDGHDTVGQLRAHRVRPDVAWQDGAVLEAAGAAVAAVLAPLRLVGDLAGDDELSVLELHVELVLAHAGQLHSHHVAVVGLREVGQRYPRHVHELRGRDVAEREVHELAHAVVDIL